jgi:hypothetical protein
MADLECHRRNKMEKEDASKANADSSLGAAESACDELSGQNPPPLPSAAVMLPPRIQRKWEELEVKRRR